jgi:tRNA/rRNA methyltransferase
MSTPDPVCATTRFVLVQPSHRGNVGAVARAMKVMGFADLVLVSPRFEDVLQHDEARAMASGATGVLDAARIVTSLPQALEGITHVMATAMTPRDFGPPTHAPRPYFESLVRPPQGPSAGAVAFVFGSERFGLSNEDVYRCHACLSIPTHADYGSLNLAQAVQIVAYEWRQALGGFTVVPRTVNAELADAPAVLGALSQVEQALVHCGFLNPAVPRRLMPRLQQWAYRTRLTHDEVQMLRGAARAVLKMKP